MGLRDAYGPDETTLLGSDSCELSDGTDAEPAGSEDEFAGRLGKPLDFMTVHKTVLTISITPENKTLHPVLLYHFRVWISSKICSFMEKTVKKRLKR